MKKPLYQGEHYYICGKCGNVDYPYDIDKIVERGRD